jgi:hypothetical protein
MNTQSFFWERSLGTFPKLVYNRSLKAVKQKIQKKIQKIDNYSAGGRHNPPHLAGNPEPRALPLKLAII